MKWSAGLEQFRQGADDCAQIFVFIDEVEILAENEKWIVVTSCVNRGGDRDRRD